jgi:hypothetical protein
VGHKLAGKMSHYKSDVSIGKKLKLNYFKKGTLHLRKIGDFLRLPALIKFDPIPRNSLCCSPLPTLYFYGEKASKNGQKCI